MRLQARVVLIAILSGLAAGCVGEGDLPSVAPMANNGATALESSSGGDQQQSSAMMAQSETQPQQATYRCDGGTMLTVQNMRSSVLLMDPQGESVSLPASPASQQSRYGQGGYALVLEGRDALFMKGGKPPLACRR